MVEHRERDGKFVAIKHDNGQWSIAWAKIKYEAGASIATAADEKTAKQIADAMNRLRQ